MNKLPLIKKIKMSIYFSKYISKPLERELLIVWNSCLQILNSKLYSCSKKIFD